MQYTTASDIKQLNKINILNFIREKEETTQPEIAKALGISKPTVSALVEELISDDYIHIRGIGSSTIHGGKRPKLLAFNHIGKSILSIHINAEVTDGALLDLKANILFRIKVKSKLNEGKQKILTSVSDIISELFSKAKELNMPIKGIGIGCPGLVEIETGTILHSVNFKELNNLELGKFITEKFRTTVLVDNEDNNLALVEHFGVGKGAKSLVSLITDVGIGAGILLDNQVFRGIDNSFGEIGHTIIDFEGNLCHCGNRGCWETYASSSALLREVIAHFEQTSILKKLVISPEDVTVEDIVEAVKMGDQVVRRIAIHDLGKFLGYGIVNIVNTFNPELVVIHGKITELGEELRESIYSCVQERALSIPGKRVEIVFSDLGSNGHILGAGALILNEMFNRPELLFNY